MLKRLLLLTAVSIVIYLLTQTYPLVDLKDSVREARQATELRITNSDNIEELRNLATQSLHAQAQVKAQHSEKAFRQMFLLAALLVCLLPLFFLPGPVKYTFRKKSGAKGSGKL